MGQARPAGRLTGLLPIAAAALGAAIVASVGVALYADLAGKVARAGREAAALADSAAEAVSRRLEAIDYALSAIAARVDPPLLEDPWHREQLHRSSRQALLVSSETLAFIVIDGRGSLVATSRLPPERMEPASLAASPSFLAAARDYRPSLSVSERFEGEVGHDPGRAIVAVSRSVLDADGMIGAVVSAILPADGAGALLPRISIPGEVTVLLALTDGTPIGRLPDWTEPMSLRAKLAAMPGAIVAARAVRGGSMAVIVAHRRGAILTDWAGVAVPVGAAALLLAVALALLARRLAHSIRRLESAATDLAAREEEMRRIADALGIGLWVRRSAQARTEYFGDFVERLTGKPRSILESRPNVWREQVVLADDRDELMTSYRSCDLRRGWQHSYRIAGADGTVRWVEDKAIQLPGPDGGPGPVYGAVTDVTEIRAARETIARQARQLADAMRMARLCFWRIRPGGDRYEWDEASFAQFGVDPRTFDPTPANVWSLIEPEDRAKVIDTLARVAATGQTQSVVFRFRRLDGTPRIRWSIISPERDESGRVVWLNGASQDITEREELAEALTKRDLQMAEAGRLAGLGFWRRPLDGTDRLEWSAEMYRHIGETPETFTPTLRTLYERIVPEDSAPTREVAERVLATGEPGQVVYRIRRADGTLCHRWVSMAAERGTSGEVTALSGVALDITDEIEAEQRIARQERQIAEVGRVAGIGFYSRSPDGARFETTPVFRRQHGFAEDQPITFEAARGRIHPEDRPALRALTERLVGGADSVGGMFRAVLPDGNIRRIRIHSNAERDEAGQVTAINGITQDVTEEVEARERLERQQAVLETARRAGRIGFFRRAFDSDRYEWSPETFDEYGVDPATFVPTTDAILAMIHPEDRAEALAERARMLANGETGTMRVRIIRPDGTVRWRESVGKLQRDEAGRPIAVVGVTRDITEEVEARAQIAEQAERLRQVERVAKVGFYRRALDGTQMQASEEKLRQFGLPPGSGPLDVSVFRALFHPEDLPRVEEGARRIVETGTTETATVRIRRPDGEVRWLRIIAGLERAPDGRPVAVTGLSQDVTEEVEAAERLRRQDRLLADAGRVAKLGFWRRNLGEDVMEWSDGVFHAYGLEPGSLTPSLGLIRSRIHPDDLPRWEEARERLAATGESQTVEYRLRLGDGALRWLRTTAGVERDRDGAVTVFGITQDVTESVDAVERLARQRRQLAEAGRVAGVGFWRLPLEGDRFELSESIFEQMGLDPAAFVPNLEAMRALILEEDREPVFAALEKVRQTGERISFTYRLRRPDGSVCHRSSTAALERAADGTPLAIVGVSQDISDRVEQDLRLQRSQRLNALGELTGGIAHDVNNLLSVIGLNLELLRDHAPAGEAHELTEAALQAVGQGAKLTRGLLAFAQRQSLRPAPLAIDPLLQGLETLLRRALGGRVQLCADVAAGTPPILADSAQFESALVNLVLNARDAMPEGGTVTITACRAAASDLEPLGLSGEHVRITVADDGVGMPTDVLARAFEPFFTTKGAGKGTGLGLAMVYGFARQSGGEVRIESSPGAGTAVTLWLPAAAAVSETLPRVAQDHGALRGAAVLIVEDEPPLRTLVERLCADAGMLTHAVADGEAAMALLRYGVRIDLLLSDIRMPGRLDGHALAIEARLLRPDLPIVLMTGYDDTGSDDLDWPLLRKPFSRADLLDVIADALRQSPVLQPAK